MIKSGKFISALLLSSALICAAIPSQSLQAQTVTVTKEAISDDLYCVTELVETSGSGIQPFSATQTKSGSKTQRYVNSSGTTLWYVTVHASLPITEALLPAQALMLPQKVILQHGKLPINRVGNPEIPDMLLQQAHISFQFRNHFNYAYCFHFLYQKRNFTVKRKP